MATKRVETILRFRERKHRSNQRSLNSRVTNISLVRARPFTNRHTIVEHKLVMDLLGTFYVRIFNFKRNGTVKQQSNSIQVPATVTISSARR